MPTEDAFLAAVAANPADDLPRLVYADWLDERDDPRGPLVRLHAELRKLGPDHVHRVPGEVELSRLRKGCEVDWLAVVEPERKHLIRPGEFQLGRCRCYGLKRRELLGRIQLKMHVEPQDTENDAWKRVSEHVEAAVDGREVFSPLVSGYDSLHTLPPAVATLQRVKRVVLYGPGLLRLPPEVGDMTALEEFSLTDSRQLHWFPFELTHCRALRHVRVSPYAVYDSGKGRMNLPSLVTPDEPHALHLPGLGPPVRPCSVCARPFEDFRTHRVWISLRVATDVMPLLVNACSRECVLSLPTPPDGYHPQPHRGGLGTPQRY